MTTHHPEVPDHSDAAPDDGTDPATAADAALLRAIDAARAGLHRQALTAARQATDAYRALAGTDPTVYGPDLAQALGVAADCWHAVGEADKALDASAESATIFRNLADGDGPEAAAFAPYLATALDDLALRQDRCGAPSDALATTREATAVHQRIAAADPEARPGLAQSMNNLAVRLRENNQLPMAIVTSAQAAKLYGRLAEENPNRYRTHAAVCLDNLANMYDAAGRDVEALRTTREVVEIYRATAADAAESDKTWMAPLAMSINNLAVRLAAGGRSDEALSATAEAIDLYRRLVKVDQHAYRGRLAGVLDNYGADLAEARRFDESVAATREAVDLTRKLSMGDRRAYAPQLAQTITNLAVRQHAADAHAAAMASAYEASRLYRELADGDPERYRDAARRATDLMQELAGSRHT